MTLRLYPYQEAAVQATSADWDAGIQNCLTVIATGGGKTAVALESIRRRIAHGGRALFMAHTDELIAQPVERIAQYFPEWLPKTGVIKAEVNDASKAITVASVPTLANPQRLANLLAHGLIDVLVIDEAHHSTSDSYQAIIHALAAANPKLVHMGLTATPLRTDGDGLGKTYQKVSARYGIKELIKLGFLVPIKSLGVQTGIETSGIRMNADGDYSEKGLANAFDVDNVWDIVVATHLEYADDRKAIAFTPSVAAAYHLAAKMRDAGISAEALDGTTPRDERRAIIGRYQRGETRVLANCNVLMEGFDAPDTSCIHWCRPTRSDLIYTQGIGRGLRPFPGKADCLILDYVPLDDRNIIMAGDLLGKPRKQRKAEAQAMQAGVILNGFSFTGEGNGIDGDPNEIVTRELDYLSMSPWQWYYSNGITTLGLGQNDTGLARTLVIMPGRKNPYGLVLVSRQKGIVRNDLTVLATAETYDAIVEIAADYAEQNSLEAIAPRNRAWQRQPISDKQLAILRTFFPTRIDELMGITKGAAGKLITHAFAVQALRRERWLPQ